MPTWPFGFPDSPVPTRADPSDFGGQERLTSFGLRAMAMKNFAKEMSNMIEPELDDWVRPQPRCIRRVEPYEF